LEYMHYVEHDFKQVDDPNYEFPLHNGEEEIETIPFTLPIPIDINNNSSYPIISTE
ncbi:13083_t:CDS:1, partial [Funneliformis geosporum]